MDESKQHKSGFVSILGNPNVGKSTLMNRLVGERLSIVTSKAQTTRHRIFGIVDTPEYQIVYSDTPGVLAPVYELQRAMLKAIEGTLEDSDVLLYITDVIENPAKHEGFLADVGRCSIPKVVLVNKIDLSNQADLEKKVDFWHGIFPGCVVLPVSALHGFGVEQVQERILDLLPVGEKFFPPDTLTDRPVRFFVSEIVREKVFLHCQEEVPYSVEVGIRTYEEGKTMDRIEAIIYVSRESQKGILIGHQGSMLKRIGMAARRDMETFLQKRVYLRLLVQVADGWRDDEGKLRQFGYVE